MIDDSKEGREHNRMDGMSFKDGVKFKNGGMYGQRRLRTA